MPKLTPVPGAEPRYDDDGNEVFDIATCGTCGRSWNDAAVSSWTPAPSGRCPFEYEHEEKEEASLNDVVLDLVQILSEAADSGRLVGGDSIRIEDVTTDGYIDRTEDRIVLKLSNGEKVELQVEVTGS